MCGECLGWSHLAEDGQCTSLHTCLELPYTLRQFELFTFRLLSSSYVRFLLSFLFLFLSLSLPSVLPLLTHISYPPHSFSRGTPKTPMQHRGDIERAVLRALFTEMAEAKKDDRRALSASMRAALGDMPTQVAQLLLTPVPRSGDTKEKSACDTGGDIRAEMGALRVA